MKWDMRMVIFWLIIIMVVSFAAGAVVVLATGGMPRSPPDIHTAMESIEWKTQIDPHAKGHTNITASNVEIVLGAGELLIRGGESPLMTGIFTSRTSAATSSDQEWQPEIHYYPSGGQGILTVHQPKPPGGATNTLHNSWDITLNREIPMNLRVVLGAGESTLEVGGLNLTGLDVETGAGHTVVDLVGTKHDLDVTIKGGVGEIILRIPRDIGVKIDAEEGIGRVNVAGLVQNDHTYTNALFERSDATIRIAIDQAIGEITVEQMG